MRSYERSGLTVDQCTGCRGIFLDRGELERLVDAESAYYERFPPDVSARNGTSPVTRSAATTTTATSTAATAAACRSWAA